MRAHLAVRLIERLPLNAEVSPNLGLPEALADVNGPTAKEIYSKAKAQGVTITFVRTPDEARASAIYRNLAFVS